MSNRPARERVILLATAAAIVCLALVPRVAAQCQYSVTVLPEIQCTFWISRPPPAGINNLGHVAAYSDCGGGPQPVLWTGGDQWTFLPLPPGFDAGRPYALNDLDEVVGEAVDTVALPGGGTLSTTYACLWRPGRPPQLLGIPAGGNFSIATGINNHSEICGYWGNSAPGNPSLRAFIWRGGVIQDLVLPVGPNSVASDINDETQITGWMGQGDVVNARAFIWSQVGVVDLGTIVNGFTGEGVAIGQNGMVSGQGRVRAKGQVFGRMEAGQWRSGSSVTIGALPSSDETSARGGNDFATVGYCDRPNEIGDRGFLYQDASLYDLTDLNTTVVVNLAQDISAYGEIVGTGRIGNHTATVLLTPIGSEPADVTRNCVVNIDDLLAVISEWGSTNSFADINEDGEVGIADLLLVIEQWGPGEGFS